MFDYQTLYCSEHGWTIYSFDLQACSLLGFANRLKQMCCFFGERDSMTKLYIKRMEWNFENIWKLSHQPQHFIICPYMFGWWFGTFFLFPYVGNVIIPTDELIFFRGVGNPHQYLWLHYDIHSPYHPIFLFILWFMTFMDDDMTI